MRILSWNVNGLRAAERNGFLKRLEEINADIVCLQEVKTYPEQLSDQLRNPLNYYPLFNPAKKKGYSKLKPLKIEDKIGLGKFDGEGRSLKVKFSNFILLNVYMPHGGRKKENMGYKLTAYSHLLASLRHHGEVVVAGDFNIAHHEIDLARPNQNHKNTMFTTKERSKIDDLVNLGFEDSFRLFNQKPGYYSWFPYGFDARERNLGWRIDYAFVSKDLRSKMKTSSILKDVTGSDHCPVLLEIEF